MDDSAIPLTEAAALFPRRNGKKVHVLTLKRRIIDGCRGFIASVVAKWNELKGFILDTFSAIKDALAAGDTELAWKILTLTLQQMWNETLLYLKTKWIDLKTVLLSVWTEVTSKLTTLWLNAQRKIAQGVGWILAKAQGLDPAEMAAIIDEDYDRKLKAADDKRQARLNEIHADRQAQINDELAAARKRLEQIKRERAEAMAAAKEKAAAAEEERKRENEEKAKNLGDIGPDPLKLTAKAWSGDALTKGSLEAAKQAEKNRQGQARDNKVIIDILTRIERKTQVVRVVT